MTADERAWQITTTWADGTNDDLRDLIVQHIKIVETAAVAETRNIMHNQLTNLRGNGPTLRPTNLDQAVWDHGWDTGVAEAEAAIRKGVKP